MTLRQRPFNPLGGFGFDAAAFAQYGVEYRTSEVIFWEATPRATSTSALAGQVEISRRRSEGRPLILATIQPGDFFGEMGLMNGLPRSGTAVAKADTRLLALTADQLEAVLEKNPGFATKMIRVLCHRLRKAGDALSDHV